jgi:hypothetical protein
MAPNAVRLSCRRTWRSGPAGPVGGPRVEGDGNCERPELRGPLGAFGMSVWRGGGGGPFGPRAPSKLFTKFMRLGWTPADWGVTGVGFGFDVDGCDRMSRLSDDGSTKVSDRLKASSWPGLLLGPEGIDSAGWFNLP